MKRRPQSHFEKKTQNWKINPIILVIFIIIALIAVWMFYVKNISKTEIVEQTPQVQQPMIQEEVKVENTWENKITENTYSSPRFGITLNYPVNFFLNDEAAQSDKLFVSETWINFPDICEWCSDAPISISKLNQQDLDAELNSLESKTETPIIISWINTRKISGISTDTYDKNIKYKLFLVVFEDKGLVVRGFEHPANRKIIFDLETIFDQIVNSIQFTQ